MKAERTTSSGIESAVMPGQFLGSIGTPDEAEIQLRQDATPTITKH
ncbi:hypothetical protein [Lentzea atacamensis]|nr:hypothetical protein [Lentzea atacamensis]